MGTWSGSLHDAHVLLARESSRQGPDVTLCHVQGDVTAQRDARMDWSSGQISSTMKTSAHWGVGKERVTSRHRRGGLTASGPLPTRSRQVRSPRALEPIFREASAASVLLGEATLVRARRSMRWLGAHETSDPAAAISVASPGARRPRRRPRQLARPQSSPRPPERREHPDRDRGRRAPDVGVPLLDQVNPALERLGRGVFDTGSLSTSWKGRPLVLGDSGLDGRVIGKAE